MTHKLCDIGDTYLKQYFVNGEDLPVLPLPSIQFQPFFDLCLLAQQRHAIHQFPLAVDFVFVLLRHIVPEIKLFQRPT